MGGSDVQQNSVTASPAKPSRRSRGALGEKDVVKEGGGGRKGKKRGAQIKSGDVFIKALIDGESSRY